MPSKRMFNPCVIETDEFLELQHSAQVLYFHLCMNCDNAGFFNNSKSIMKLCNCVPDDLNILIYHGYVEQYAGNLFFIKHWRVNNNLRNVEIKGLISQEAYSHMILDGNKMYIKSDTPVNGITESATPEEVPTLEEVTQECILISYPVKKAEKFISWCEKHKWYFNGKSWRDMLQAWKKTEYHSADLGSITPDEVRKSREQMERILEQVKHENIDI